MEIPRIWREQSTRIRFDGRERELKGTGLTVYKYPGGEIPLVGSYQQIREKFVKKGFTEDSVDQILFDLWGGVSTEAAIPLAEVAESFFELVGGEIGK